MLILVAMLHSFVGTERTPSASVFLKPSKFGTSATEMGPLTVGPGNERSKLLI
jgi:hypothetical protein